MVNARIRLVFRLIRLEFAAVVVIIASSRLIPTFSLANWKGEYILLVSLQHLFMR